MSHEQKGNSSDLKKKIHERRKMITQKTHKHRHFFRSSDEKREAELWNGNSEKENEKRWQTG